jgi:peptidoglycan hydrolase CwlO-like protein
LKTTIPTLPLSATQVNYTNDNSVVKAVQTRLRELDDQIIFLNDHLADIGTLETIVMTNSNEIAILKRNIDDVTNLKGFVETVKNTIPQLPLSGTHINYTNTDNELKRIQTHIRELDNQISFLNDDMGDIGT